MNWGDWEGQKRTDLHQDAQSDYRPIEEWGWHYAPPKGESPAEVRARVLPWTETLAIDTLAVCHIGIMRVLLAHAYGWDFDGPAPFQIKRNRLYVIDLAQPRWCATPDPLRLIEVTP